MSQLGRYRARVMTRQRKHLILYMTAAAAFHAGAVTAGWVAWQLPEPPQVESPTPARPIEFVYLDAPETAEVEAALRRAQVSQKAAGEKVEASPTAAGKAVEFQKEAVTLAGSKGDALDEGVVAIREAIPTGIAPSEDQAEKALPQPAANASRPAIAPASPAPVLPASPAPAAAPRPAATPVAMAPAAPASPNGLPALSPAPFTPPPVLSPLARPPLPPPQPLWEAALPPPPDFSLAPPASPALPQPLPEVSVARNPAAAPPPPGQGLDGIANPDRTTAANSPGLSAQRDPVWGEYVTRLNQEVHEAWQQVPIDRPYRVTVRLTLDRAGNLLDLQLAEPSGFADADAAAIAAVQQSAPFEPFPAAATRDRIRVNLTFNYNLVEQGTRASDPGARE